MIDFFVPGIPQPQGNHRVSRAGYIYDANDKLDAWRSAIVLIARRINAGNPPLDEPVAVDVLFRMPRPKHPRFPLPATKPDCDKLQRAIGDALETAGVITNDSRIVAWHPAKIYADQQHPPGARIRIRPVTQADLHPNLNNEGTRP